MSKLKLVVGLGNPGQKYSKTRHNVGFWFIDELAKTHSQTWLDKAKFFASYSHFMLNGEKIHLLKPNTFMNLSGKSVQAIANFHQIEPQQMLIIHDELDIACGDVKLKFSGGHGGHNGLRDITSRLASNEFYRLRIGIGHPGQASLVTPYVLSNPNKDDHSKLQSAIDKALTQLPLMIEGELEAAMNNLHRRN